jgi:hypothetical protein
MSPKEAYRQVKDLEDHPGWALVRDMMQKEIDMATRQLVDQTRPAEEQARRHGAIWAAYQLLDVPSRLLRRLENQIAIQEAEVAAKAATRSEQ